jgi:hypothetical protein
MKIEQKKLFGYLLIANLLWTSIVITVNCWPESEDTTLILVNQLGYYPFDQNKRVLFQTDLIPSGFESQIPFIVYKMSNISGAIK